MVNLFTFWWDGVQNQNNSNWFGTSLSQAHAAFNYAFTKTFPKLLYTEPFTAYTDEAIFRVGSRITGTGETTWNEDQVRNAIIQGLTSVGITGDVNKLQISLKSIEQIQQGQQLTLPDNSNITTAFTEDGKNEILDNFTTGIKTPMLIALVAIGALVLLRR